MLLFVVLLKWKFNGLIEITITCGFVLQVGTSVRSKGVVRMFYCRLEFLVQVLCLNFMSFRPLKSWIPFSD